MNIWRNALRRRQDEFLMLFMQNVAYIMQFQSGMLSWISHAFHFSLTCSKYTTWEVLSFWMWNIQNLLCIVLLKSDRRAKESGWKIFAYRTNGNQMSTLTVLYLEQLNCTTILKGCSQILLRFQWNWIRLKNKSIWKPY